MYFVLRIVVSLPVIYRSFEHGLMLLGWVQQRYVELFRSTKGEMMTAVQQRMYGMFSGAGGFSQFGVGQVRDNCWIWTCSRTVGQGSEKRFT